MLPCSCVLTCNRTLEMVASFHFWILANLIRVKSTNSTPAYRVDWYFSFVSNSNYSALERTLFYHHVPSDRHMELWEVNNKVHKKGLEIVKPGMRCSDVARELNEIYMEHDMLQYRVIGYGHSMGVLTHYYGRDWDLEFLEHVDTVLKPGMVITMEPMIVVPEGQPGAGGYRDHDTLIITENGTENTTASFPIGPEQNVVKD